MSTPVSNASNSMRAKASEVVFCLVNEYREHKGLPSFQWNDALQQAANEHCVEASLKPPTTKKELRPSQAIRERIHSTLFALQEFADITLRVAVPSDADPTTMASKVFVRAKASRSRKRILKSDAVLFTLKHSINTLRQYAKIVFRQCNEHRVSKAHNPLSANHELTVLAEQRAQALAAHQPVPPIEEVVGKGRSCVENTATCVDNGSPVAVSVVQTWKDRLCHGEHQSVGIGVAQASDKTLFFTQILTEGNSTHLDLEKRLFVQTNSFRKRKLKSPFAWSQELAALARVHSQNIAAGLVQLSHEGLSARAAKFPFQAKSYAENVGKADASATSPAQDVFIGWTKSKEHLKKLKSQNAMCGVGAARAHDGCWYFTQILAARKRESDD